jgi:hypothetical protein
MGYGAARKRGPFFVRRGWINKDLLSADDADGRRFISGEIVIEIICDHLRYLRTKTSSESLVGRL